MSKIVDIYTALADLIESTLPGYTRLPNPYSVDTNTYLHLKNGYGIGIGAGRDTERYVGCIATYERVFTIILVKIMSTTQNNTGKRVIIEEALLTDHTKLKNKIYQESTLGNIAIKSTILDDQGIGFIDPGKNKYLSLEMNCYIEYQEDPTAIIV